MTNLKDIFNNKEEQNFMKAQEITVSTSEYLRYPILEIETDSEEEM